MKLPHGVNPAHVASKDATRYVLNGVQFAHGLAVGTNGRMLVAAVTTREDDDADREAIVPTRAMLAGFKVTRGKGGRARSSVLPRLVINAKPEKEIGTVTITDKNFDQTTVQEIDGNFPAFEQVFEEPEKATLKLALNAKFLSEIAKALGDEQLVLHLDPDGFKHNGDTPKAYSPAIYLTAGSDHGRESVAILMPIRVSSDGLDGNRVLSKVAKIKAEKAAAKAAAEAAAEAAKALEAAGKAAEAVAAAANELSSSITETTNPAEQ